MGEGGDAQSADLRSNDMGIEWPGARGVFIHLNSVRKMNRHHGEAGQAVEDMCSRKEMAWQQYAGVSELSRGMLC